MTLHSKEGNTMLDGEYVRHTVFMTTTNLEFLLGSQRLDCLFSSYRKMNEPDLQPRQALANHTGTRIRISSLPSEGTGKLQGPYTMVEGPLSGLPYTFWPLLVCNHLHLVSCISIRFLILKAQMHPSRGPSWLAERRTFGTENH